MALTHEILQFELQINNSSDDIVGKIEQLLIRHDLQDSIIEVFRSSVRRLLMMVMKGGGRITVELYDDGFVCIDVVQLKDTPVIEDLSLVEKDVVKAIAATIPQRRFAVYKGVAPNFVYFMFGEEMLQYKFTKHLYSAKSPYQQIDIYDSEELGAVLFLDYDTNISDSDVIYTKTLTGDDISDSDVIYTKTLTGDDISDSDVIYTKTLTGDGKYHMENSKILILGGGDGAALREVLNYNPGMVIMIEIDEMVIDAVREHMRDVCGNVLDHLKGDNYEIIINNCIPVMKELIKKEEIFDFILYDLTEIPVTNNNSDNEAIVLGTEHNIKHTIMDLAMTLLSPSGTCIAQGHKGACTKSSNLFKEHMKQLHCPVDYSEQSVYVPSYREKWTFYSIWKK